jgi:predicted nucleotidyltransferase
MNLFRRPTTQVHLKPSDIDAPLQELVLKAKLAFGENLLSVTLFGSGAQDALRPTSDVNLIMIFKEFQRDQADAIADLIRFAHAQISLEVMFLLESEIQIAAESFPVKFIDICSRHKVIHGKDYLSDMKISPERMLEGLKQVLTNLILRMREKYVLFENRPEILSGIIADNAGPLRSAAFSLVILKGGEVGSGKEALERVVGESRHHARLTLTLKALTEARQEIIDLRRIKDQYFEIIFLAEFLLSTVVNSDEPI